MDDGLMSQLSRYWLGLIPLGRAMSFTSLPIIVKTVRDCSSCFMLTHYNI